MKYHNWVVWDKGDDCYYQLRGIEGGYACDEWYSGKIVERSYVSHSLKEVELYMKTDFIVKKRYLKEKIKKLRTLCR